MLESPLLSVVANQGTNTLSGTETPITPAGVNAALCLGANTCPCHCYCPLALAEADTRRQERQWRKTGYFVMHGVSQEDQKLTLKSLNSPDPELGRF